MEKTQFIVQIQLLGNNVDKVVSVGISPDEFENITRAEKIGMKLIKRVEIIQETTLVSHIDQRVSQPQQPTVESTQPTVESTQPPTVESPPQLRPTPESFSSKFGKPSTLQEISQSEKEIDDMITKPNET